jgi:DNA-binding NarL/FixJ family response regulator
VEERRAQLDFESLSRREIEVLQALADGLSAKEIAQRLHVSSGTIRNHLAKLLSKLGVHSQLQAIIFAVRHGLVDIEKR